MKGPQSDFNPNTGIEPPADIYCNNAYSSIVNYRRVLQTANIPV